MIRNEDAGLQVFGHTTLESWLEDMAKIELSIVWPNGTEITFEDSGMYIRYDKDLYDKQRALGYIPGVGGANGGKYRGVYVAPPEVSDEEIDRQLQLLRQ